MEEPLGQLRHLRSRSAMSANRRLRPECATHWIARGRELRHDHSRRQRKCFRKTYERAGDTGCRFLCQPNGDPRTAVGSSSREPNEACGGCRPHRWNPKPLRGRWRSLVGHRLDQLEFRRRRAATRKLRRKPTSSSANPRADPPVWRNAQSTFPRLGARVLRRLKGMRLDKQASVSDHARHQPPSVLGA